MVNLSPNERLELLELLVPLVKLGRCCARMVKRHAADTPASQLRLFPANNTSLLGDFLMHAADVRKRIADLTDPPSENVVVRVVCAWIISLLEQADTAISNEADTDTRERSVGEMGILFLYCATTGSGLCRDDHQQPRCKHSKRSR